MSFSLSSGMKIFDVIKILWQNPASREEICEKLKSCGTKSEVETISKYIRTLRRAGFEIKTNKGLPFEILDTPFKIDLSEEEKEGALFFGLFGEEIFKGESKKEFRELVCKLNKLIKNFDFKIEGKKISYNQNMEVIDNYFKFNQYIFENKSHIKVSYNKEIITIFLIKIKCGKNGIFVTFYNEKTKEIQNANIAHIKELRSKVQKVSNYIEPYKYTIFKIKGGLKNKYVLKQGETASYKGGSVYITSCLENKEELFFRLMKYGKNCEIVYPKEDRKAFIALVQNLIEHYKSM